MKVELERLLAGALDQLQGGLLDGPVDPRLIVVERTRDSQHGDFASNIALRLAKAAGRAPRELAAAIIAKLPSHPLVSRAEVAGAGFINFYLAADSHGAVLRAVLSQGDRYGCSDAGQGRRILL